MNLPYAKAPHAKGAPLAASDAPNAALLIDFDNVTMGMRSDLSKELKNLLNSDIIKGKVTVQRAYADWRRYPQYIVPLSENSVDLIFAPAYGSSKKNATDIRMAIDAMELIFIRPEIGTFILLTGDSDFSSVVLKLKEYGKYVIGVGIQESSSDILVQNCDEYYSYTSLTGLRKTTDSANKPVDPWVLVEKAVERMASRDDVMRSDRLKQVMIEMDPSFDEGNFGFSKFSRFLSDAAGRSLVRLRKLDNGQYEVFPFEGGKGDDGKDRGGSQRKGDSRDRGRDREEGQGPRSGRGREGRGAQQERKDEGVRKGQGEEGAQEAPAGAGEGDQASAPPPGVDPLQAAYSLLTRALKELAGPESEAVRDSDLKRKMLELQPDFDEGELGFGKFSRFLRQAHDHEVVDLQKREEGTYQVAFRKEIVVEAPPPPTRDRKAPEQDTGDGKKLEERAPETRRAVAPPAPGSTGAAPSATLRLRTGSKGRRHPHGQDGPPPLLEGQLVEPSSSSRGTVEVEEVRPEAEPEPSPPTSRTPRGRRKGRGDAGQEEIPLDLPSSGGEELDPGILGLPTDGPAVIRYLTNSYKGVGQKTAETLVETFGPDLFAILLEDPARVAGTLPQSRADQLLEGWKVDLTRRRERRGAAGSGAKGGEKAPPAPEEKARTGKRRTRRGSRGRGKGEGAGGNGNGPSAPGEG